MNPTQLAAQAADIAQRAADLAVQARMMTAETSSVYQSLAQQLALVQDAMSAMFSVVSRNGGVEDLRELSGVAQTERGLA